LKISNNITSYIPQREPIVMISSLLEVNSKGAKSSFFIKEDNIFNNRGFFDESGIIENIAQTAAAMTGYNAVEKNIEVKKGFIGSINNLRIIKLVKVNSEIETNVTIENVVMGVHIIKGSVKQASDLVAECEMKIFLEE